MIKHFKESYELLPKLKGETDRRLSVFQGFDGYEVRLDIMMDRKRAGASYTVSHELIVHASYDYEMAALQVVCNRIRELVEPNKCNNCGDVDYTTCGCYGS